MFCGWDLPKVRVSDIREALVSAFASQKPPDGSLSNRAEALKVGLEHAKGLTYPIWPWKFSGLAGVVPADRGCLDFRSFRVTQGYIISFPFSSIGQFNLF